LSGDWEWLGLKCGDLLEARVGECHGDGGGEAEEGLIVVGSVGLVIGDEGRATVVVILNWDG
jgi:hypothetical protein